jgi:nucleoside 2-deoxyribosyltransferase
MVKCRYIFEGKEKQMKMYLAHPIKIRREIRDQELQFERNTGIELINPFYDPKGNNAEVENIKQIDKCVKSAWTMDLDCDAIVNADLESINLCEGIVAWVEKTVGTIGTFMEIWEAFRTGKKVYVISPDWDTHPWLRYVTIHSGGKIVKSFKELEEVFKNV